MTGLEILILAVITVTATLYALWISVLSSKKFALFIIRIILKAYKQDAKEHQRDYEITRKNVNKFKEKMEKKLQEQEFRGDFD